MSLPGHNSNSVGGQGLVVLRTLAPHILILRPLIQALLSAYLSPPEAPLSCCAFLFIDVLQPICWAVKSSLQEFSISASVLPYFFPSSTWGKQEEQALLLPSFLFYITAPDPWLSWGGIGFIVPLRGIYFLGSGSEYQISTGFEGRPSLAFYSQESLTRASIALEHLKATEQMVGYRSSLILTVRNWVRSPVDETCPCSTPAEFSISSHHLRSLCSLRTHNLIFNREIVLTCPVCPYYIAKNSN